MMIPEAWELDPRVDEARRGLLAYNAALMEPGMGPPRWCSPTATRWGRPSIAYQAAARALDPHGGAGGAASEAGVFDVPPADAGAGPAGAGPALPGGSGAGRATDAQVKADLAGRHPYPRWLGRNVIAHASLPPATPAPRLVGDAQRRLLSAFGYAEEDLDQVLAPMAQEAMSPSAPWGPTRRWRC
ncbi:MAG: hypothetical protein R3F43_13380 [bacterium]